MRGDMSNIGENKPIPGKSAAYNVGFSQGYTGVPLKGHHTQQFLAGYINGTASFQQNKGFSEGYSKVPMSSHTKDYIDAYNFGVKNRVTDLEPSTSGQLPAHTNDHYMHYYIGIHDGGVTADQDSDKTNKLGDSCPSGHTQEYCTGYKQGYDYEDDALHEW